ncbi:HAD family hydrolase [Halocalculus aciditolerans]|uniref:HAD family hydrolase n=1 Tax=Halocalculus aciditolerans TaxID=1383812 RepID=A0A830FDY7_9EURY|nr:HAD family hydrolase [Halocalculus aciditolerans]GGL65678.1 HAD family hydrolase [Halocalculus aciditolerans]
MLASFDLFGTLVDAARPANPAAAVADELAARGVRVPDAWNEAYREPHVPLEPGREISLFDHVLAALDSRGVAASRDRVAAAVTAAFDGDIDTRAGALDAVEAAAARGPVGVLSNCSVPGLATRALDASALDSDRFDAVVVSVDCGWRKPDPRAFAAVADALGGSVADLVHVGDDPATDGGVTAAGGTFLSLDDTPLRRVPERVEALSC